MILEFIIKVKYVLFIYLFFQNSLLRVFPGKKKLLLTF